MSSNVGDQPTVKVRETAACQDVMRPEPKGNKKIIPKRFFFFFKKKEKLWKWKMGNENHVQSRPQSFTVIELCCILTRLECKVERALPDSNSREVT